MADVDLRQLAVDRNPPARKAARDWRRVTARYVLPSLLILGFAALVGWSARNVLFPPRSVSVVPVLATTAAVEPAGTTLFQAAGWIEPRPTPIRVAALAPGVVESLLVVEDQYVSVGEPIAELIKRDAELEIARAEANLSLRKAELDEAEAAHQAAKIRFEQPVHLKAAVSEAQSLLAKTETELQNLPFQIRRAEADLKALRQEYESKLSTTFMRSSWLSTV